MEQNFTSDEDAYAEGGTGYAGATPPPSHGRRQAPDDPTGMPERTAGDEPDGDEDEGTVHVRNRARHGSTTVVQNVTAGNNAAVFGRDGYINRGGGE